MLKTIVCAFVGRSGALGFSLASQDPLSGRGTFRCRPLVFCVFAVFGVILTCVVCFSRIWGDFDIAVFLAYFG